MYAIELTDTVSTEIMPVLNVPLSEDQIEGATDVTTLDMKMYTDFIAKKRLWSHTWRYMTEADFNSLKGFYGRQFTTGQYPELTIADLSVSNIPVRMTLSPQRIIDNCGTVENVEVTFREAS